LAKSSPADVFLCVPWIGSCLPCYIRNLSLYICTGSQEIFTADDRYCSRKVVKPGTEVNFVFGILAINAYHVVEVT